MSETFNKVLKIILDLLQLVLIGAVVAFIVFFFIGQPLKVSGDSMIPTFKDGEQLIAEKLSIKSNGVQRGDIVIFKHPENPEIFIIKRIIGMPNESIKIENGDVFVNGSTLEEPYLLPNTKTESFGKLQDGVELAIPDGEYILLGDNRGNSSDSRAWGTLKEEFIIGKSYLVYFPFQNIRLTKHN